MLKNRGFTLIELLVVISIISLLSSVVISNITAARVKARDTKRISDLQQIRTALELYYNTNGYYPSIGCGWDCNGYAYSNNSGSWWDILQTKLAPYISKLPVDPVNSDYSPWTDGCYSYAYGNVGRSVSTENPTGMAQYDLTTQFEDKNNPLRCEKKIYRFYFDNRRWCGPTDGTNGGGGGYSNYLYEASPN